MTQRWRWIAVASVAIGSACGYWYFTATPTNRIVVPPNPRVTPQNHHDGDAEASDRFEPLVVDGGTAVAVQRSTPSVDDGPMPPVVLEPGMDQPPRPDAEPGVPLRMPYADE